MAFEIRNSAPEDEAAVSALLLRSYGTLMRGAYDDALLEKAVPLIARARPELLTSGRYYVAETPAGRIVGAGGWSRNSPTGEHETPSNGNIRHFGTDLDFTRKGIGRALLLKCLEEASKAGVSELNCYSSLNGESFYAAFGFQAAEPFPITLPGGIVLPGVRMTRFLEPG